ncbi:MAG: gliding motility-associated C-terminal domain-containing protein, partial [Bacteroidota bacterium]
NNTSCDPNHTGIDTLFLQNQNGCDSLIITNTLLTPADTTLLNNTSCDPNHTGIDTIVLQNQNGCDSIVITNTLLTPADTTFLNNTSCDPNHTGVDTLFLQDQNGCDSIIITITELLASDTTWLQAFSCDPGEVGMDTTYRLNRFGCDSLIIQETQSVDCSPTILQSGTCDATATGIRSDTFSNQYGLDSIVVTEVILWPSDTLYRFAQSCYPADTGMVVRTYVNQWGCDSIELTYTELLPSDTLYQTRYSCEATEWGDAIFVFQNQWGCDSTVVQRTLAPEPVVEVQTWYTCDPSEVFSDTLRLSSQAGCDSLIVQQLVLRRLELQASPRPIRCRGEANGGLYLQAEPREEGPFLYALNDGAFRERPYFDNLAAGAYVLRVQNYAGCETQDTVTLADPPPLEVELGMDQSLRYGDSLILRAAISAPYDSLSWSPTRHLSCAHCPNPVASPPQTTLYQVKVYDRNGCSAEDQLRLRVERERPVYVPSAFSPNGDGVNDHLQIYTGEAVERILAFRIFNRWGELVYELGTAKGENLPEGWDGHLRGRPLNPGVFVYQLRVLFNDGGIVEYEGDLTLVK